MSGRVSTSAEIVSAGKSLPAIADAEPLDGRRVLVTWKNGETKLVDLGPALASRRIYIPLRGNDALFHTLRVSAYGDALEWDGGIEFSAIWIERLPALGFSNADFREAMAKLGLSLEGMAAALEISRRLVAEYRKDKPIPRHIALATQYLVTRAEAARSEKAGPADRGGGGPTSNS